MFQLQQPEVDGQEHSRRFRIENGGSPGEKEEVSFRVPLSVNNTRSGHKHYTVSDTKMMMFRNIMSQMFGSPSTPVLENPEYQTRWYFKYFLGKCKLFTLHTHGQKHPRFCFECF